MASESDGGGNNGGQVHDLTIEILKTIRDEVRGVREEVHGLRAEVRAEVGSVRAEVGSVRAEVGSVRAEVGSVRAEVQILREEVHTGFAATTDRLDLHSKALATLIGEVSTLNGRFDNFLTGAHRDEHDELRSRIERIEERLDKVG